MRLNICMLGPSGAGKTSMMTAIFMDARRKLVTHPSQIKIYPDSDETTQRIQAAISQFEWTLRLESSEVAVLSGNAAMSEYKFRFHIPNSPQPIDVNILDYRTGQGDAGSLLKTGKEKERKEENLKICIDL